jgi:ornithine cyclodeaminase
VLRFLHTVLTELAEITVFDLDRSRAKEFAERCATQWPTLTFRVAERVEDALGADRLISFATTATSPHLDAQSRQPARSRCTCRCGT